MARKHLIALDVLIAKLTGGKVDLKSTLFYSTFKTDIDFNDDDIINKRAVTSMIAAGSSRQPNVVPVIAGQADPVIVNIPNGYNKYNIKFYDNQGKEQSSRINDITQSDTQIFITSFGEAGKLTFL